MIVSDDWAICTPKKCGTHSLNSLLTQRTNHGYVLSPWHRRDCPGFDGARVLVVRCPMERLVSMYHFTNRVKSAWLKQYATSFRTWSEEFFSRDVDENRDWRLNCAGYADEWQPDVTWRLEDVDEHLAAFFGEGLPELRDLNSTKGRPAAAETLGLMYPHVRASFIRWAAPDVDRFGYDLDF